MDQLYVMLKILLHRPTRSKRNFFYSEEKFSPLSQANNLLPTVRSNQCCGAGAGFCSWSRLKGSGSRLLLCYLGVPRLQSCDSSYNFSRILTIFTQIERKNKYTF